jgi:hypothetical protein
VVWEESPETNKAAAVSMSQFAQTWLRSGPSVTSMVYVLLGLMVLVAGVGFWLIVGRGPRRRRALKRVKKRLQEGAWQQALDRVRQLARDGRASPSWQLRFRQAEAECLQFAGAAALREQQYEQSLDFQLQAAKLLGRDEGEAQRAVVEAMLSQARQLFVTSSGPDTYALHQLLGRVLGLQSRCPEAVFWIGLCHLRAGNDEQALAALEAARDANMVDPPLYLGGLLLRRGQPKDAIRFLTEANRADSNCPLVKWQLGTAILESGGDAQLGVRALQQVLSPRGLPLWSSHPARLWVEAFSENRSYVRKLAREHPYVCPLWGNDLSAMLRQCNLTLAQGLYQLGKYQEPADLYDRLLQESAPSVPVLRGLGLALARMERFDQAFKHLRAAHEMEEPKDRITAGYLALCGARGKPSRPEDKARNVAWAVQLVIQFTAPGDAEWVGLVSSIFAEARALTLPLTSDEQIYVCEHLVSIQATEPEAAEAYLQLAAEHPQALRADYAWLYCRAAQQHGLDDPRGLELFAHTFAGPAEAQAFFVSHEWDFTEVELAYLQLAAKHQPGQYPAVLGADYAKHGEALLLERSRKEQDTKNMDASLSWAEVLRRLAPQKARALDRLADLQYHRDNLAEARDLLEQACALAPRDVDSLRRLAVVQHQLGDRTACNATIRTALEQSTGPIRAALAFLGARLALQPGPAPGGAATPTSADGDAGSRAAALEFLQICLQEDPRHANALTLTAALRSLGGDRQGLAALAPAMQQLDNDEPRFHYLAALCSLAAGSYSAALDSCRRAAKDAKFAVESSYVAGWVHVYRHDPKAAAEALRAVANAADSPSAAHAQALLGGIRFHQDAHEEAIQWWGTLDPRQRAAWRLVEPLQHTVLLSALDALQSGKYEHAAERIREAGKLGLRDRRLGSSLNLALVKTGQQLLNDNT